VTYGNLAVPAPSVNIIVTDYHSAAGISEDGLYRYWLTRRWKKDGQLLGFVMLNPSTADAHANDRTIDKCCRYAELHGYSGIYVVNLFAYRATDPKWLLSGAVDPVGQCNNMAITGMMLCCTDVVLAWGAPTGALGRMTERRALEVQSLLKNTNTLTLKLTKDGKPGHPLYLKQDLKLQPHPLPEVHP